MPPPPLFVLLLISCHRESLSFLNFLYHVFDFSFLFNPQCINTEVIFRSLCLFLSFIKMIYWLKSFGILSFPFSVVSKIPSCCCMHVLFMLFFLLLHSHPFCEYTTLYPFPGVVPLVASHISSFSYCAIKNTCAESFWQTSPGAHIPEYLGSNVWVELLGKLHKTMPKCFPKLLYQGSILPVEYGFLKSLSFPTFHILRHYFLSI